MAHLIGGTNLNEDLSLYNDPVFIVQPHVKSLLKQDFIQKMFKDEKSEQNVINHLCHKYSQIQQTHLRHRQSRQICQKIKKRIRDSRENNRQSASSFFKAAKTDKQRESVIEIPKYKRQKINMKTLMDRMPKNFKLENKYRAQINLKLMNIQQAKNIAKQKEQYQRWINQAQKPINSPIFNRMTYVLDKLSLKSCYGHKHSKSDNDLSREVSYLEPKPKEGKSKKNRSNLQTLQGQYQGHRKESTKNGFSLHRLPNYNINLC